MLIKTTKFDAEQYTPNDDDSYLLDKNTQLKQLNHCQALIRTILHGTHVAFTTVDIQQYVHLYSS